MSSLATSLEIVNLFQIEQGGGTLEGHQGPDSQQPGTPIVYTVDGKHDSQFFTVAAATSQSIWTLANSRLSAFRYLFIKSDEPSLWVEFKTATPFSSASLITNANQPLVLFSDQLADTAANFANAEPIEEILVSNQSVNEATVQLVLIQ